MADRRGYKIAGALAEAVAFGGTMDGALAHLRRQEEKYARWARESQSREVKEAFLERSIAYRSAASLLACYADIAREEAAALQEVAHA